MEQGWDPEVKKYFVKILNSISIGLLWLMAMVIAGLYFQLGYRTNKPAFFNVLFYFVLLVSLFFLIRYYYKTWKK